MNLDISRILDIINDNFNRIITKEALMNMLESYKGILNSSMTNYLNSLINLEFSVVKDCIEINDRNAISELEIYRKIAMYNIYNRALNIFKQNDLGLIISDTDIEGLSISYLLGNRRINLFSFCYSESMGCYSKIPEGCKNMQIGTISLFQTLEREELLMQVISKLEKLYDQKDPYCYSRIPGAAGGPSSNWEFRHLEEIAKYEKLFKQLDSKKELSDEEKRLIEITKQYHDLLLKDYGLTNENFEYENNQGPLSSMKQKTLVKKIPYLNIENNITYI